MRGWRSAALAAGVFAALPGAVRAAPVLRAAAHGGYGRLVFDFGHAVPDRIERDGDEVVVRFQGAGDVPDGSGTRNVLSVTGGHDEARIRLAAGATLHVFHLDGRLVLDAIDPSRGARRPPPRARQADEPAPTQPAPPPTLPLALTPGFSPAPSGLLPSLPAPLMAVIATPLQAAPPGGDTPAAPKPAATPTPASSPALPAGTPGAPGATPASTVPPTPAPAAPVAVAATAADAAPLGPLTLAAAPLAGNTAVGGAIVVPFGPHTGAAAFRRGQEAIIVFDEARPLDLAALHDDPVFAAASVNVLPSATILRLVPPAGTGIALRRADGGWRIDVVAAASPRQLVPVAAPGALRLPAAAPGRVVALTDPEGGEPLLVGTERTPANGLSLGRAAPQFALLPSWQGVVVEPYSDRIALGVDTHGFVLTAGGAPLAYAPPPNTQVMADAAALTRSFDLPDLPTAALLRQLRARVAEAATTRPLQRFAPRIAVAQSMLALGLGPEARAVVSLARDQAPGGGSDRVAPALAAAAAVLAGRPNAAAALSDGSLPRTDELTLWRAAREAELQPGSPAAAEMFAATAKLLVSYPAALRHRLLPLAVETMARGGQLAAAASVLAQNPTDPDLAYARALVLRSQGQTAPALAAFDRLASSPDQWVNARAAHDAIMLRHRSGALGDAATADALDAHLMDWGAPAWRRQRLIEIARLREAGSDWRRAFAALREAEQVDPAAAPAIRTRMGEVLGRLLSQAAHVPPLEMASLIEDNADLVPPGPEGDRLAPLLADKLAALDLPDRAAPVLARMMAGATPGPARAAIGARLASTQLDLGNAPAALAALAASDAPGLPDGLADTRLVEAARAERQEGRIGDAVAALQTRDSAATDDLRARLLAETKDWRGSEGALQALLAHVLPRKGPLDGAQQDVVLRLASAASEAGDAPTLGSLRASLGARMTPGPKDDMFRLLTATPVQDVGDLPRSARQVALASAVPAGLGAIGASR